MKCSKCKKDIKINEGYWESTSNYNSEKKNNEVYCVLFATNNEKWNGKWRDWKNNYKKFITTRSRACVIKQLNY
ncbi:hypothetical protein [endosymbiont DhMRE of Dentiscutata heterogama]|uniref:hypothetical protein n=1 Tax=endosymbiont DhMRE of Dentiscutata heterogama TaxID=1609546 RepID=UPI002AD29041|nr:hypothetical protein [endosymbiont DhMRE of Dentiscutata heterogama]